jgi:hypothetical protein
VRNQLSTSTMVGRNRFRHISMVRWPGTFEKGQASRIVQKETRDQMRGYLNTLALISESPHSDYDICKGWRSTGNMKAIVHANI